jgi:two-component system LytT family response regulator
MNVIVVDDEISVRNAITRLLAEQFPDIEVISTAGTLKSAYEATMKHTPDLLFLDVELPDGNGFELLKMIPLVNFKVIFITGHQEYALDAIKVSALDYILKPFDREELRLAVEKAREIIMKSKISNCRPSGKTSREKKSLNESSSPQLKICI